MSLVYIRNAANNAWVPISAEAGAIPNKVNAQTITPGDFKSICGLDAPPAEVRYIRNLANDDWISLDKIASPPPFLVPGSAYAIAESSAPIQTYNTPPGAQVGDMIVTMATSGNNSRVFSSIDGNTVISFSSGNRASNGVYLAVHDGRASYKVECSATVQYSVITCAVRGHVGGIAATVWNPQYAPEVNTARRQNFSPITLPDNSFALFMNGDRFNTGYPYTPDANFSLAFENQSVQTNYSDMFFGERTIIAGETTPNPDWNSSGSGRYQTMVIGFVSS